MQSTPAERIPRAAAERTPSPEHAQSALLRPGPHGCFSERGPGATSQPSQRWADTWSLESYSVIALFCLFVWNVDMELRYMISETSSAVITVVLNMTICVLMQNVRFQRMTTSSWLMGWMRLSSTSPIMETPLLPSSQRSLPSSPLGSNWWSLSELIYWWGWRKILLRLKHSCMWYLTYSWNVTKQIIVIWKFKWQIFPDHELWVTWEVSQPKWSNLERRRC